MAIDNNDIKTWLAAATCLSSAIPGAGPILKGIFSAADALIPADQVSQFQAWEADLSSQFTKDQLASQSLICVYYNSEFDAEWSNQDYAKIDVAAQTFVEPSSDGSSLQDQVGGMIGDVLASRSSANSILVEKGTFDSVLGQAWPFLYLNCSALLRLAGAYVLAQWNTSLTGTAKTYAQPVDTPAAGLLTHMSANYMDFATWYYNAALVRRLRKIYCYSSFDPVTGKAYTTIDEGIDGIGSYSTVFGTEVEAMVEVVNLRQVAISDLAGVFAMTLGATSQWGAAVGADNWPGIQASWYENYALYADQWSVPNSGACPVAAVPAPPTLTCWIEDRGSVSKCDNNFWDPYGVYLYCFTCVVGGVEGAPSPAVMVSGSAGYVGIELLIPADPTGLAQTRNIYKTVIMAGRDEHNVEAKGAKDAYPVGSVDGAASMAFYDVVGYDAP